jgi:acylphosphatase
MSAADTVRRHVVVSGRVQAVGFRASCQHRAQSAGLGGYVRNLADGRVEAAFEGPGADVEELVSWCRTGPPLARVVRVEVNDEVPEKADRFVVR